jgi:phage-related baseplate assembly protein
VGDPTRSLYHFVALSLETVEETAVEYIKAGFLDWAEGDWLTLLAYELYGVERTEATYASGAVTLSNGGGGYYVIGVGDVTLQNTATGKTYRNTAGGTLNSGPGTTLSLEFTADEAGSDSNSAATEIDALVTTLVGVTCSNPAAFVALDAEGYPDLRQRCRDKLGSLSPNGPRDAYSYVAQNRDLSDTSEAITRVRVDADTDTGDVLVYIAGADGAVAGGDVTIVEAAITEWALPVCTTTTVASASNVEVPVTYSLWLYSTVGETEAAVETAVEEALIAMFAARPVGGDVISPATGRLYHSMIESTIRGVYPAHAFRCTLSLPAADTDLAVNEVAVLGAITATVTLVDPP